MTITTDTHQRARSAEPTGTAASYGRPQIKTDDYRGPERRSAARRAKDIEVELSTAFAHIRFATTDTERQTWDAAADALHGELLAIRDEFPSMTLDEVHRATK